LRIQAVALPPWSDDHGLGGGHVRLTETDVVILGRGWCQVGSQIARIRCDVGDWRSGVFFVRGQLGWGGLLKASCCPTRVGQCLIK
jgi:hypothetical protein